MNIKICKWRRLLARSSAPSCPLLLLPSPSCYSNVRNKKNTVCLSFVLHASIPQVNHTWGRGARQDNPLTSNLTHTLIPNPLTLTLTRPSHPSPSFLPWTVVPRLWSLCLLRLRVYFLALCLSLVSCSCAFCVFASSLDPLFDFVLPAACCTWNEVFKWAARTELAQVGKAWQYRELQRDRAIFHFWSQFTSRY
jgi:hypothetical protein